MFNIFGKRLAFLVLPIVLLVGCTFNVKATPTPQTNQTLQVVIATSVQQTLAALPSPTALPSLSTTPTSSSTPAGPSTPAATNTPAGSNTPALTATGAVPIAHINLATNCRIGPGTQFANVYVAPAGTDLTVVSATTLNNYVVVDIPNASGQTCWLLTQYADIRGSLAGLPVVTPPPTPTPTPTPTFTPTPTTTLTPTVTPTLTPTP